MRLVERLSALEAHQPALIRYDLSGVPAAVLEKLAAAEPGTDAALILTAAELATLPEPLPCP